MATLFKYLNLLPPESFSEKPKYEPLLEEYKCEALNFFKLNNKTPTMKEIKVNGNRIDATLRRNNLKWNEFLTYCNIPISKYHYYWTEEKGLKRAKKQLLKFYKKYKRSPTRRDFESINAAIRAGHWIQFGINSWANLLENCNLKVNVYTNNPTKITIKYALADIRIRAKMRKHSFNLTLEDLEKIDIFQPCVACQEVGSNNKKLARKRKNLLTYNSIDRIDSKRTYTIDNIQILCKYCQKIKYDWSMNQLAGEIGDKMIKLIQYAQKYVKNGENNNVTD